MCSKGPRPKRGAGARQAGRRWISLFAKCAGCCPRGDGRWLVEPPKVGQFISGTFTHFVKKTFEGLASLMLDKFRICCNSSCKQKFLGIQMLRSVRSAPSCKRRIPRETSGKHFFGKRVWDTSTYKSCHGVKVQSVSLGILDSEGDQNPCQSWCEVIDEIPYLRSCAVWTPGPAESCAVWCFGVHHGQ